MRPHAVAGIDIGSVALKSVIVALDGDSTYEGFDGPHRCGRYVFWFGPYVRTHGRPREVAEETLSLLRSLPGLELAGVRLTGSIGQQVAARWGVPYENEFLALARGVAALAPEARTVLEMGGETSKILLLRKEADGLSLVDYDANGDCAAGTGSFIDQQAGRLGFPIESVGAMVSRAKRIPKIAGRCSVFAKSDMIHAQQRGFTPEEVLAGLCDAVARNYRASVAKSRKVVPPVAFVGGVAANAAVAEALARAFELPDGLVIPPHHAHLVAAGAALAELGTEQHEHPLVSTDPPLASTPMPPLSMDRVMLLRNRTHPVVLPPPGERARAFLGVDVGSVSTNLAVIDEKGTVLWELYVRTRARPIEVVRDALHQMARELGDRVCIAGVGTTGSGRELIGSLVGADVIKDEITAHKTGACFVAAQYLQSGVDTILEIGGQDAKYIRLQDGVVVDFTMNDACAAGTGSFLEERAAELGVSIVDEFATLALSSKAPVRLGERCTVFMERDVYGHLRRGAPIADIAAGLAYSVVQNYVNRVVRGRPIDGVVFFQGGTAYNDAVAAAFSHVLGQTIIVPPYNGVIGAIGVALLAREWAERTGLPTSFRGLALDRVRYVLREFTCRACQNYCNIQEFNVEGERTYWGDQCSDRFRARQRAEEPPVIEDLYRLYHASLPKDESTPHGPVVGIPRTLHLIELLPFWHAFFTELGWSVLVSPWTNKDIADRGVERSVAEPCFPVRVAHGHASWLLDHGADIVFVPALIDRATTQTHTESYVCVWGQTLPHVLRAAPGLEGLRSRLLAPAVRLRTPRETVHSLALALARYGVNRKAVARAFARAQEAQGAFVATLREAGNAALATLERTGRPGVVLVGRPYNTYDRLVCLDVPSKLRTIYGVNVIPLDFLDLDAIDIRPVEPRMYWHSGRRIIAAAMFTREKNLHLISLTNFKCGPDSFIKHSLYRAGEKPFLTLSFDGHANDAGIMTRCEAFLESKGMLGGRGRSGASTSAAA